MSAALQPSVVEPQILDLRHYGAHSLRPLLQAESRTWAERLDWDYRASTDLLLQYLDARVLPGFVAMEGGRAVGYTFCVYEDRKAIVGDLFALPDAMAGQGTVEALLLEHLLELLTHSPGVERAESQLLLQSSGSHASTFSRWGFRGYRRLFMMRELGAGDTQQQAADESARLASHGFAMRSWAEEDFEPAGRLIARAYEGHIDAEINDQYRSVTGSLRFLHNIIRFPGCGVFDPAASRVVEQRGTGLMAGILLCSRVRENVAHVTQACVAPQARGLGLASAMLQSSMAELAERGFRRISLTVTDGNEKAERLYQRLRFRAQYGFDALVWTQPEARSLSAG